MSLEHDDGAKADELRLALAMRGGVSLAVWIGGACGEIDVLRRFADPDGFWKTLMDACGYQRVVVDVLAGASAGGLNGVLFASAIRHGFPMEELDVVWRDVASVQMLRRSSEPWLSLFDGDASFLDRVRDELRKRVPNQSQPCEATVDLQLTATLVEPLKVRTVGPPDEELWRQRSVARFHFRHDPSGVAPRRDLEADNRSIARLALAARATSSFPGAFEGAIVRSSRPTTFVQAEMAVAGGRLVDCRGVFSESAGPVLPSSTNVEDADFVVGDGGIVDNIPLGRAIEAVAAASASSSTRRVLVYLHPSGPSAPPAPSPGDEGTAARTPKARANDRRGVRSVITGVIKAKIQDESIDGDLAQLDQHNRAIRRARLLRRMTVAQLGGGGAALPPGVWQNYVVQRSAADASRLRLLLDDPITVLGDDPFPVPPAGRPTAVWHAPLVDWQPSERAALDEELTSAFAATLTNARDSDGEGGVVLVGLAPLRRSVDFVLEWARAASEATAVQECKPTLYHLRSIVSLLERSRRLGWVTFAGLNPPTGDVAAWCESGVSFVDSLRMGPTGSADNLCEPSWSAAAYLLDAYGRLDAVLADGVPDGDGGDDLRLAVRDGLGKIVDDLLEEVEPPAAGHPAELVDLVLRSGIGTVADRLGRLEILSLAEHLAETPAGPPIAFYRISAANETPLASQFVALSDASRAIDKRGADGWQTSENFLRPEVKLAGNELSNFSAFLDRSWRQNDWRWGRLDAASGLIEMVLDSVTTSQGTIPDAVRELAGAEPDSSIADVRRRLVARRQLQILRADGFEREKDLAAYKTGLESLNRPGSYEIQVAAGELVAVATNVLRTELPNSVKRLAGPVGWIGRALAWRATKPRGGLPRASAPATNVGGSKLVTLLVTGVIPAVVGALVAFVAWGLAESTTSLLIGLVAGSMFGLALVLAVLGIVLRNPPRPEGDPARATATASPGPRPSTPPGPGLAAASHIQRQPGDDVPDS